MQNKIYNKKFNFNEDLCLWEGWKISVRTSEPTYMNMIFIIMRRKFLPPYFDTFQSLTFIISEKCSREAYEMNPKCNEIIELAANTIFYSGKMIEKEYSLFLRAKLDSLLVDEETMMFFQNSLNIVTQEIFEAGYTFTYCLLVLLNSSKEKSRIAPIKQAIEQKIRALNNTSDPNVIFNIDL